MYFPTLNNGGKAFDLFENAIRLTLISKLWIWFIKILEPAHVCGAAYKQAGIMRGDGVCRAGMGRMRNDDGLG